ncbi:MAG: hypothetical protein M3135_02320, partial [Actinomycetota bacterium]|nr:hypothetical protein [Actinomycetota bacterium]
MAREETAIPEETLLEPATPRGPALPPHAYGGRPFLWLVLSAGADHLAFWGFFAAMWSEATFRLGAGSVQIAFLLVSYSVPFVVLAPLQGALVDRWSAKWLNVIGAAVSVAGIPVALGSG